MKSGWHPRRLLALPLAPSGSPHYTQGSFMLPLFHSHVEESWASRCLDPSKALRDEAWAPACPVWGQQMSATLYEYCVDGQSTCYPQAGFGFIPPTPHSCLLPLILWLWMTHVRPWPSLCLWPEFSELTPLTHSFHAGLPLKLDWSCCFVPFWLSLGLSISPWHWRFNQCISQDSTRETEAIGDTDVIYIHVYLLST